jgi:hypothetical protein
MLARLVDALRRLFRLLRGNRRSGAGLPVPEIGIGKLGPTPPAPHPPAPPPPPTPAPPVGPTLAMAQLMAASGAFPARTGQAAGFTLGMIQSFAGRSDAFGTPVADGRMLPVVSNQPLMAVIGLSFGGDGVHLGLPDLRGRTPVGGQQIGMRGLQTLALTWLIATEATSGAPVLGMAMAFGATMRQPDGWSPTDRCCRSRATCRFTRRSARPSAATPWRSGCRG